MKVAEALDLILIRRRLNDRLAELQAKVCNIEEEQSRPIDDDFAESAFEREQTEVLDGLEREVLGEIAAIGSAISRLDGGTYGQCSGCGEPIPARRLEVLPTALRCVACASSEQQG